MFSLPLCSRSYWKAFTPANQIAISSYSKYKLFPSSSFKTKLGINHQNQFHHHHYKYRYLSTYQNLKAANEVKEATTTAHSQNQMVLNERKIKLIPVKDKNVKKSKLEEDLSGWTQIYRCDQIVAARVLQRFKIGQTVFTLLIAAPLTISGFVYNIVEISSVYMSLGASILASTMLYVIGNFFSRLIGNVYVSKSENPLKTLRIARLDFWGGRVDEYIPIENIVPLSEYVENYGVAYVKVKQLDDDDDDDAYNITFKYGTIIDEEKFESIFGGLPPT